MLVFNPAVCVRWALLGAALALCGRLPAAEPSPVPAFPREVENLATFARVYGYVRFFHPSDAATQVDWNKLAFRGSEEVRGSANLDELRAALLRVFRPIAPGLEIGDDLAELTEKTAARQAALPKPVTFWQYQGLNPAGRPGPYRQSRVIVGATVDGRLRLFEPVTLPDPVAVSLASGLAMAMPTVVAVGVDGRSPESAGTAFAALRAELGAIDLDGPGVADWRVRVVGVIAVWSAFQHFHPYLDERGIRWEETLRPALQRALRDASATGHYHTLSEMIAASQDGHGYVYWPAEGWGGLPVRVAVAEDQLVVIGVAGDGPLRKGDVIVRVDGAEAREVLRDRERYTAGSPHLCRFRALNQFGEGPVGRPVRLEVEREGGGGLLAFELERQPKSRGYFFKMVPEFTNPAFAEVRPGIFYLNLSGVTKAELAVRREELANARAVIFDWRALGHRLADPVGERIQPHADIIPHLIDGPIQASPMLTPQITAPDRAGWSYRESTWPVLPKAPRFKGRIVFINEPSTVSYGETCMAMIAGYKLATLVGEATAGCNGNANFVELPAGFRVMWTGMDVRRHDRTSFYGVGFEPDVPMVRTVRGIREGRDEYLEAAIAYLEKQP